MLTRLSKFILLILACVGISKADAQNLHNQKIDGYRGIWFTLGQLFKPVPVDDYAARVLAERYLKQQA